MFRWIYEKLSRTWYKLVTLRTSPRKIAAGLALGIFISYTPTFGCQMALGIGLAALFRVNPIAAVVGVQLTNFATVVPIYILCYKIGSWLVGASVSQSVHFTENSTLGTLLNLGKSGLEWLGLEAVGGVVLGIPSAILAYFLCLWAVVKYRTTQLNRRIEQMRQRVHEAELETNQKTPAHAEPEKADDVPPPAGESKS